MIDPLPITEFSSTSISSTSTRKNLQKKEEEKLPKVIKQENKPTILTKKQLEEEIMEDLVKKSKDKEVWGKDYDMKTGKIIDTIEGGELTDNQLEKIKQAVLDKINNKKDA